MSDVLRRAKGNANYLRERRFRRFSLDRAGMMMLAGKTEAADIAADGLFVGLARLT
jgi:hypothetical protein